MLSKGCWVGKFHLVGSRLHRRCPNGYTDGVYMIEDGERPSARILSDLVFQGPDGLSNDRNVTTMLAFFSKLYCLTD